MKKLTMKKLTMKKLTVFSGLMIASMASVSTMAGQDSQLAMWSSAATKQSTLGINVTPIGSVNFVYSATLDSFHREKMQYNFEWVNSQAAGVTGLEVTAQAGDSNQLVNTSVTGGTPIDVKIYAADNVTEITSTEELPITGELGLGLGADLSQTTNITSEFWAEIQDSANVGDGTYTGNLSVNFKATWNDGGVV